MQSYSHGGIRWSVSLCFSVRWTFHHLLKPQCHFFFLQLYCPNGISPMGKSGCFPHGKPAAIVALPNLLCMLGFLCFHNSPNSDMDYRIFNVRTDVNACDCTQGCTDTRKRVCTESRLWEKKIPCRTRESILRQRRDGPMPYQLSYIPTPTLH